MEILIAKNAGFCFGVQNAIDKAERVAEEGRGVYTYGPIIHNRQVVENLKSKGVDVKDDIDEVKEGDKIIIRSHGVPKKEYEELAARGSEIIDATCPYVKHIHKVVEEKSKAGYKIVIIGDPSHPEVKGINGWCDEKAVIINGEEDINKIDSKLHRICVVSQTTFNEEKWYSIICRLVRMAREMLIINTICNATELRQKETMELSKQVDVMIVVGGKESSNTRKLFEISKSNCDNTIFIETAEELDLSLVKGAKKVGITAGASTPDYIIQNVVDKIKEIDVENEKVSSKEVLKDNDKDMMGDYSLEFKKIHPGMEVEGRVILVTDKEVYVDIGYKSDGILPSEEASNEEINLREKFNEGDIIKVEVIRMNDGEGNVVLSRKSIEEEELINSLKEYKESGKVIEVAIKGVNKGGFDCVYNSIRAFMPLSLSGISRDEDSESYIGKKLKAQIADVVESRNGIEIVVSRRELMKQERERKIKETFDNLEYGQVVKGKVKSIIDSGAFVNIGYVDVFVPISEISWRRVNKIQDFVKEGDEIEILLIRIDKEELKATGSLKRLKKEPWEEFALSHNEGDIVEGKVVRFADFGAFVELAEGVDGLIHISNMADRRINRPQEVVKAGQIVKAKILMIDKESRRIGLTLKDIE
ncbi:bifunctional 4-hydroxy-3-methylbut-2-enyl diphosphate reductase/30S ribosomal protein S1 [Fonticella tunisiensis]|uniref:4-hydroxy-3-methylbut-2-enyl diphosphate reductase n=1 Tax=Fonticella tunisiensis TaxID=1096341 RepID=A0A4R7KRG9_9CLOT|nr:bifunctional 4-hydroxy-3-methylbut-2-enyl diphosphate reductase/30S ribosomal protein S1 [Fonticella tunisiensis]TDT61877.1 4-hydroxy-3-methylbut-2-enyl diphosphate reductase [Fonticella tunisiensis]